MSFAILILVIGTATAAASCGASQETASASIQSPQSPSPAAATAGQEPAASGTAAAPVNQTAAATKAFQDRIKEYVTYHNNVEKMVPPLTETKDPTKIAARERALGEALIKQRPDAKQGDFFIPQYQPILVGIIKADFAKRPVADRRAMQQELPEGIAVEVNTIYPTTLPLATFPANLLEKLPELPPELEYRIVGRTLILRDVTGNVIVDLMRDVVPTPK